MQLQIGIQILINDKLLQNTNNLTGYYVIILLLFGTTATARSQSPNSSNSSTRLNAFPHSLNS
jgi:hypothetical protein